MNQFYFLCLKGRWEFLPPPLSPIRKLQFFSLRNCLLIVYISCMFVSAEGFNFISICSMISKKWLLRGLLRSWGLVNTFYSALFTYSYNTTLWLHKEFPLACLNMPFEYVHLQSRGYRAALRRSSHGWNGLCSIISSTGAEQLWRTVFSYV